MRLNAYVTQQFTAKPWGWSCEKQEFIIILQSCPIFLSTKLECFEMLSLIHNTTIYEISTSLTNMLDLAINTNVFRFLSMINAQGNPTETSSDFPPIIAPNISAVPFSTALSRPSYISVSRKDIVCPWRVVLSPSRRSRRRRSAARRNTRAPPPSAGSGRQRRQGEDTSASHGITHQASSDWWLGCHRGSQCEVWCFRAMGWDNLSV